MITIKFGAGVRTLTMAGVTYNLNSMDRHQMLALRNSVVGKVFPAKGGKK